MLLVSQQITMRTNQKMSRLSTNHCRKFLSQQIWSTSLQTSERKEMMKNNSVYLNLPWPFHLTSFWKFDRRIWPHNKLIPFICFLINICSLLLFSLYFVCMLNGQLLVFNQLYTCCDFYWTYSPSVNHCYFNELTWLYIKQLFSKIRLGQLLYEDSL